MTGRETADETSGRTTQPFEPLPGVLLVHSGVAPAFRVAALEGGRVGIGRDDPIGTFLNDDKLSRHHAEVTLNAERWTVRDRESRNGTFVNGKAVVGVVATSAGAVVRAGGTVVILLSDVRPFTAGQIVQDGGVVRGPRTASLFAIAARAAAAGGTLLITGESGTGKELIAHAFHAARPRPVGPFIAVNCATIPEGVAERVLFGAKRGAYSGATNDVDGHVQAAEGGVLFLDEIGELDLTVQAKLLRLLETNEITPLGSSTSRRADVRFCCATNRDLRAETAAGRFRSDLYYRLNQTEIALPALRERREEIPWLIASIARKSDIDQLHAKLVEACLLFPWPGNVRELLREARHAAEEARHAGDRILRPEHLRSSAGRELTQASRARSEPPTRAMIEEVLAREDGNISSAARNLGLHRTQLRRLMQKLGLRAPE